MKCRICFNNRDSKIYVAREMMFGYKDRFEYMECSECGCLQIKNQPTNLSKYYPPEYYSFAELNIKSDNFLKRYLLHKRSEYCLFGKGIIGKSISFIKPEPVFFEWLRKCKIGFESKILDVGCGTGQLLLALRREGFNNLVGIDPYISCNIQYKNGVRIFKGNLIELAGSNKKFDLIMLHHSFEHMPEPLEALQSLYRLLSKEGFLLIRIPIVGYAWRYYGVNWVQLDAPRHLYIHTVKSISILAKQTDFVVADISYDSTEFQFWGSEQYMKNIPLRDNRSYLENQRNSIFSEEQIASFRAKAIELNNKSDGDQACFYLRKSNILSLQRKAAYLTE